MYTVESPRYHLRWILAFGMAEKFRGDFYLGYWKGGPPDIKIRNPAEYGDTCKTRENQLASFIKSVLFIAESFYSLRNCFYVISAPSTTGSSSTWQKLLFRTSLEAETPIIVSAVIPFWEFPPFSYSRSSFCVAQVGNGSRSRVCDIPLRLS